MLNERNTPSSQVLFFDNKSYYSYFAKCPCGDTDVANTLCAMESCIPLALTEKSLNLFLQAYSEKEAAEITNSFMQSSKADFLMLIQRAAKDQDEWDSVILLCESLRQKNKMI